MSRFMLFEPTNLAVIRPASYGIRDARGFLLYWENESRTSQHIDSWTTYKTPAEARAVAIEKNPDAQVLEETS